MQIHFYDELGYYTRAGEATPGDVPGSWQYPDNAILKAPPSAPGKVARRFGQGWELVPESERDAEIAKAAEARMAEEKFPSLLAATKLLVQTAAPAMPDATALAVVTALPEAFPVWLAGDQYGANEVVLHGDKPYRVVQTVTAQAHQPPSSPGMLAIYRPIALAATGTENDPIPFVMGMDAHTGQYFSYEGRLYVCRGDMIPCSWAPGTAGLWQWELVRDL